MASDLRAVIADLIGYLRSGRRWWLIPAFLVILLMWVFIATAGTSSVPVFVYPVA